MIPGVVLALSITAAGQQPQVTAAAPVPSMPDPVAVAALAHRRDQITVMEGVLAAAVANGARQALRELQGATLPGPMLFSSQPRARGFPLEGYGVFFNLEIPTLRPSTVWSMQAMERDMALAAGALDSLRALADSVTDLNAKKNYQAAVRRLEQQVGLPASPQRQGGTVAAVNETAKVTEEKDPEELYTTSVINACLEAMIEHSKPMDLRAEEWLTIALSATEGSIVPGEITDRQTIVLRIKGADLADYLAGRTTREEVRKKVDVRMF